MYVASKSRAVFRGLSGQRLNGPRLSGRGLGAWRQYQEQVIGRHGSGKYTILLQEDPVLRGLGRLGASPTGQLISSGAGIATTIASPSIVSAAGLTAGTAAAGALTAGIGAGVAIVVGLIASAWSAHKARAAGAKSENAAMNSAVQAFDTSIKAIFAAANSGQVTGAQAGQLIQQLYQSYWAGMAPYMTGAGRADASHGGMSCGTITPTCNGSGIKCDKSCTAGCCVGCSNIMPTIQQALAVFASPTGGTVNVCQVYGSKYGGTARGSYSLTYTPPAATAAAGLASSASALTASLGSSALGSTVAGIPLWLILAAGVGVYVVARR